MLPLHRVVVLLLFVNPAARKESRRDNFLPGPFRDWIRLLCFADTVKPRRSWEKRSAHLAPSTLDKQISTAVVVCSINEERTSSNTLG